MARRAKESLSPIHLVILLAILAVTAVGGYLFLNRKEGASFNGITELSLREYLENSNALSNNTYRLEGVVDERLDNWRSNEGRLFSVLAEQGGESIPVPVLVPAKFNSSNIQRGQRLSFKVTVQASTGVLEVVALNKA